ncbi:Pyridoxal kinase [Zancudomyces culisetae]|uniref:pyridoxal kinase n=1 Tax=Zancudomyces culisetae TaxID=1213189 RepID=A0A1R1PYF8_ZANCU|nr:Pyridoxal kinase [Zancudomyces culisetae]|eukprot:OMH85988.1 Pyridoxal kinase [Zancudomyces culisetae]
MPSVDNSEKTIKVLSVQSHVVSGYVGNRAATFPMQYLGLDVDVINTVQFSNHTQYEGFSGQAFGAQHVLDLFNMVSKNGLHDYDFLLSGYMGTAENVDAVKEICQRLRENNKKLFFVLDTVLGDYGSLYVPEALIGLYKKVLCPLASLVTPNQFEAELLTDRKIKVLQDAVDVINDLHDIGIPNVVVTSAELEDVHDESLGAEVEKQLHLIGSQLVVNCKCSGSDCGDCKNCYTRQMFIISFPFLSGYFTGAGDLFCSLLLARIANILQTKTHDANATKKCGGMGCVGGRGILGEGDLVQACERALATQATIIKATHDYQQSTGVPAPEGLDRSQRKNQMVKGFELRLIPNREYIANPKVIYKARKL